MDTFGRRPPEKAAVGWDILLIDDAVQICAVKGIAVEECDGVTIVTARSEREAMEVLRTVTVDMIWNYLQYGAREQADAFRAAVSRRYPAVRVVDLWHAPSPGPRAGAASRHAVPMVMREDIDCENRRHMFQSGLRGGPEEKRVA